MEATGIVRKIDELGRIVVPKELRDKMDMPQGTSMEIFVNENQIILKKYQPGCQECGTVGVHLLGKSRICRPCAHKLSEI